MKYCLTLLFGVLMSMNMFAQSYSDDVTLVSQDETSVTLRATAVHDKKKDAEVLAVKSAFHCLFMSGVPGVKGGTPMMPSMASLKKKQSAYVYRMFSEDRYLSYIGGEVEKIDSEKFGGKQRVTVKVTIKTKSLCADIERNQLALSPTWNDSKKTNEVAALNPYIVIVPDMKASEGSSFAAMRKKIDSSPALRHACDVVAQGFRQNGYKTRDFISQMQNASVDRLLRAGTQTDTETMIAQQLPGDIVVRVGVNIISDGNMSDCKVSVHAIEKQTNGDLAKVSFASGQYHTQDSTTLINYALQNVKKSFFTDLNGSFEEMIQKGREVFIDLSLSESVTDWDFEQDSPATGTYFQDAFDEWLRSQCFQGVHDTSVKTSKYIKASLNIPLWDMQKNRSYTLSNFGSDMRKFFKAQFGDNYKVKTTALGQKLSVVIE